MRTRINCRRIITALILIYSTNAHVKVSSLNTGTRTRNRTNQHQTKDFQAVSNDIEFQPTPQKPPAIRDVTSLNSVNFLSILSKHKGAIDVEYKRGGVLVRDSSYNDNFDLPTSVEYTGKIFSRSLRFRETIRLINSSQSISGRKDRSRSILCHSEYFDGKHWVDCSRVVCNIIPVSRKGNTCLHAQKDHAQQIDVKSEILLKWLPVGKRKVQKMLNSKFRSAANEFFGSST